ncbi:MAG: right-handed parallel beta-helix repeat-containing protein [Verrucomicrobia bacterium]|nr:right-handed parallel beta-helix repeat-containing protein [Verrucomicrobiota bacterium]MCH8526212.1 hypothetical protein [Kiritimatiellia bacterium]
MSLLDFDVSDSVSVRTAKLQSAIDRAHDAGGGIVAIPQGIWELATFRLRGGVTLEIPARAVLKASGKIEDYPALTVQDANKDRQPYHFLMAEDCEDVAIVGDGIIDGNGMAFWNEPMRELARRGVDPDAYCDEHGLPPVYRNANHPWYREKSARPSPMLEFKRVRRLRLRGITIANSPGWTVHAHDCDDLHIHAITIANNLYGPNTDGLDLNGCRDVRISDCDLTCGDDAIILKTMGDSRSCERVAVSNCIISSNCAALGLGAENTHPIRDICFTGCVIRQALRAVQIEMWDTGTVENVVVSNLTGTLHTEIPLQRAIYVNVGCNARPKDGTWGICRNLQFSNISLNTRGRCLFTAPDGARIENVTLRDVHLIFDAVENAAVTVPKYPSSQMSNHCPEARVAAAAVVAQNVDRLQLLNVMTTWPGEGTQPANAAAANQELNPHLDDVPMHGVWLRNCVDARIESPFLRGFRGGEDRFDFSEIPVSGAG